MQSATLPQNEIQRIQALNDTNLLDTPPEQLFDSLTESLAQLFSMPVSLVCLVDSERVWLKSSCGLDGVSEIQRDIGFCPHTITQTDIFEIKDASVDKRFHDSLAVANAPYFRYYAGAPLITSDGYALGTLCVMDYQPRELSESQKIQLKNMASTVTALIEARRQQNIQELSKEFKLGAMVEISPIETFLVDKSSGKILYANRAALLNLGISLNKAKDLRWDELFLYIPQKLIDSHLNSTASYFSKSISFQSEHKRGDGSTYPVSVQIKPVGSSTSEFLILSSDTSKQVEAKNRETSLQNKITHMDRINTANTLSSGLAHELNQPLTAITQYCNTALSIIEKNSLENDTILHDAIQKATSQAHRAAEIIKRYRAFTQKHIPSRSIVNIAQLIQESTSLLRHNLSKNNIELTTRIDDVPLINADHIQIQQVLLNLLTNSIEALNDNNKSTRKIEISCSSSLEKVICISITDNGPGINNDLFNNLLTPNLSSKPNGTGLGISICSYIIKSHNGKIWHDTNHKNGARITFTIPAHTSHEPS